MASGYRQRLATDDVWLRAGYGGRLVTGGVRSQIAFGRLSAGGVVLQPASGNKQRLVTGGDWSHAALGVCMGRTSLDRI